MTSGPVSFRRIDISQLVEILALERRAFEQPWSASMMRDSISAAHNQVWGLVKDNQLVAFALLSMVIDEAELLSMAVDPECQRQGLGAQLLEGLMGRAKKAKVDKLHLEVRKSNVAAIKLYEKYSFQRVGERAEYYPGLDGAEREDAILMTLFLQT